MNHTLNYIVEKINSDKEQYIDLLLVADPFPALVSKYLEQGDLFIIRHEGEAVCAAVVVLDGKIAEIKNLSTSPPFQKQGYGKRMVEFLVEYYKDAQEIILATGGTGIPGKEFYQLQFYRKCGFVESHIIRNFFVDNFPDPIIEENGEQCVDMIYMKYDGTKKDQPFN